MRGAQTILHAAEMVVDPDGGFFGSTQTLTFNETSNFFSVQNATVTTVLTLPNSATLPTTDCDEAGEAGRIYIDNDATSGSQLYICEGASGWVLSSGGGGSGSSVTSTYGMIYSSNPVTVQTGISTTPVTV